MAKLAAVKPVGRIILLWITLMSGLFSLVRELILNYRAAIGEPVTPTHALELFGRLAVIALIFSLAVGWWLEHKEVERLSRRVALRVTFAQRPRYVQAQTHGVVYRVGVINGGPGPAADVQLSLQNVEPLPAGFRGGFPHRLGPQVYGPSTVQSDYQPPGVRIGEGEEEYFSVVQCWLSGGGNLTIVGLDGFEEHGPGLKRHRWTTMQPGDRWTLTLRLSATAADPQVHRVELRQEGNGLDFRLLTT